MRRCADPSFMTLSVKPNPIVSYTSKLGKPSLWWTLIEWRSHLVPSIRITKGKEPPITLLTRSQLKTHPQWWTYYSSLNTKTVGNCLHIIGSSMGFADKSNVSTQCYWMWDYVHKEQHCFGCSTIWKETTRSAVGSVDTWICELRNYRTKTENITKTSIGLQSFFNYSLTSKGHNKLSITLPTSLTNHSKRCLSLSMCFREPSRHIEWEHCNLPIGRTLSWWGNTLSRWKSQPHSSSSKLSTQPQKLS
jgi:hypothetical protein